MKIARVSATPLNVPLHIALAGRDRRLSLEACFDAEAIHHSRSGETADHQEAAKAFLEKRKPAFQGH